MPDGKKHLRDTGSTLIDVLIGCAALVLVGIVVLPILSKARDDARIFLCTDNLKQIGQAAHQYAADSKGKFFPQWQSKMTDPTTGGPELSLWCDDVRLGKYATDVEWVPWDFGQRNGLKLNEAVNGIVRCPESDDEETRSYAQNHWANGLGLVKAEGWDFDLGIYPLGDHFDVQTDSPDKLILFLESNATRPIDSGWVTYTAGQYGRPSDRFNGGDHVALDSPMPLRPSMPTQPPSRYQYQIPWVVDYSRHGSTNDPFVAEGETNITFADGHVGSYEHDQLYDPVTRTSTYEALWSLTDPNYDKKGKPDGLPNR